jgi:PAS domain S-box-containing protein
MSDPLNDRSDPGILPPALASALEALSRQTELNGQREALKRAAGLPGPAGEAFRRLHDLISAREHFAQRVYDTTPTAIYVYDLVEQRSTFTSRSVGELLLYTTEELVQMAHEMLPRLMHPDDLRRIGPYLEDFQGALDGEIRDFEYRMRHRNGEWRWFHSRDTVFRRDPDGRVREIVGSALDITDRKSAEEELAEQLRRAEGLHRNLLDQKAEISTYHSLITHDSTNFCATIQAVIEHLLSGAPGPLTSQQEDLLRRAFRQTFEMNRLAENAKALSRLRDRGLPPLGPRLALYGVIRRAVASVRTVHFDRPFEVEIDCADDLAIPGVPFAENIFLNLVDNAVRHAPKEETAEIRVHARKEDRRVSVSVRGGSSIDPEFLPRLFERYARGPQSTGTGLGLALIREILHGSGGSVEARNVPAPTGETLEVRLLMPAE